jgi:signal transduction histidine kinase
MKARLVALFLALLLLPLGLALWLGVRSVQDGQASAQTQARTVWSGPLNELRSRVEAFVQGWEEAFRRPVPNTAVVRTVFQVQDGTVTAPLRYHADGSAEPFFDRTAGLWEQKFWERGATEGSLAPTAGWKTWTNAEGSAFLYWYRDSSGRGTAVHGVELDSWAFLSRLSAALPELNWTLAEGDDRLLVLRDGGGKAFSQWGRWVPGDAEALLTLPLATPFSGWELRLYLAPAALGDFSLQWTLLFALVGAGLAGLLALGAWVFVRAWGASLAEAGQRVHFVNQVSHELKTPLTNILLYGELLESALGDKLPPKARDYLNVIRGESGRLGRLITNVLTFARRDKPDAPRRRPLLWDDVVAAALKPFRPGLADRDLELVWQPGAPEATGEWDSDWVGQILGNLVSNAEKYAAQGRLVEVSTGADAAGVWLRVADQGPGIPASATDKVFQPFARLDDRLTAGAAGTGLGLGIARDLARRHGGELVLERTAPAQQGASFLLTLPRQSPPMTGGLA